MSPTTTVRRQSYVCIQPGTAIRWRVGVNGELRRVTVVQARWCWKIDLTAACTIRVVLDLLTWYLEKLLPSDEARVVYESKEVRSGESQLLRRNCEAPRIRPFAKDDGKARGQCVGDRSCPSAGYGGNDAEPVRMADALESIGFVGVALSAALEEGLRAHPVGYIGQNREDKRWPTVAHSL